jgi:hypothetical protein
MAGRMRLGQVPVIWMYRGVAEVAEDPYSLLVTPGRFAGQMACSSASARLVGDPPGQA